MEKKAGYKIMLILLLCSIKAVGQEYSFIPSPATKLVPKHIKGDREFGGNGPNVKCAASIFISPDQKHVMIQITGSWEETKSDFTTAVADWTYSLYTAPVGKKIMNILSSTNSSVSYTDNNNQVDHPEITGGTLVNSFEINSDTRGDDVGNQTNDDTYVSVFFNSVKIRLADFPALPANFPYQGYQFRSASTNYVLDVKGGQQTPKNDIWQYDANLTASQRFCLIPHNNYFLIQANISGLYLTVSKPFLIIRNRNGTSITYPSDYAFYQDSKYAAPSRSTNLSDTSRTLLNQLWKLIPTGESATYKLESVAFPGYVIQSPGNMSGTSIILAEKRSNILTQNWVIQRPKKDRAESEYGYGALYVDAPGASSTFTTWLISQLKDGDIGGASVYNDNINVNILAPQHRSVGEMKVYDLPQPSYEGLEGVVLDDECQVAVVDFPTSHYTHDMTFRIKPTTAFEHLLAADGPDINFQKNIEVEWETGLGQEESGSNPAITTNKLGNSFGFYSQGHSRGDIIWNWPTTGDSMYIEGMWIWERGHDIPHTEIHPPHFVAIKRKNPASFNLTGNTATINNQLTDQFYGQRVDIFASADGSTQWNNKGLAPFAQVVNMKRQDYIFNVTTMFSKPISSAVLRWKIIGRPGNQFLESPIITTNSDGKSITINYPWKTRNLPNGLIIAQTILLYWDVPQSKGIHPSQTPTNYTIRLHSISIKDNHEATSDGDAVLYANVGENWLMLNEYATSNSNVLNYGLGDCKEDSIRTVSGWILNPYPLSAPEIRINLMQEKSFRIFARGWENDHMNTQMGKLLNEYNRSVSNIGQRLGNIFSVTGAINGLIEDDEFSKAERIITSQNGTQNNVVLTSVKKDYHLIYSIIKNN